MEEKSIWSEKPNLHLRTDEDQVHSALQLQARRIAINSSANKAIQSRGLETCPNEKLKDESVCLGSFTPMTNWKTSWFGLGSFNAIQSQDLEIFTTANWKTSRFGLGSFNTHQQDQWTCCTGISSSNPPNTHHQDRESLVTGTGVQSSNLTQRIPLRQ